MNFDTEAETELIMADLRDEVPGFDQARVLSVAVMRTSGRRSAPSAASTYPVQHRSRTWWNVGDAVKEYANGDTTACADLAKRVLDQIVQSSPSTMRTSRSAAPSNT